MLLCIVGDSDKEGVPLMWPRFSIVYLSVSLSCAACDTYEVVPSIYKQAAAKHAVVRAVPPPPPRRSVAPPTPTPTSLEEPTPEEAPTEPERDLSEELRTAYGSPSGCLAPGSLEGGQGTMRLSVVVTSGGRVTRATVSAPVERDISRCLRERAERLMFAGPIEDAPRTIAASVPLVAPPAPADQSQARRLAPGATPPAVVLPARGAGSRDTSFVAPVDTLPAIVPAERPEGFVAPQHTLPPRGETGNSTSVSSY